MKLQESIQATINGKKDNGRYINEFKHSIYNSGTNLLVCENKGKNHIKLGFFPITDNIEEMEQKVLSYIK